MNKPCYHLLSREGDVNDTPSTSISQFISFTLMCTESLLQPAPDSPNEPQTQESTTIPQPSFSSFLCSSLHSVCIFVFKPVAVLWLMYYVYIIALAYYDNTLSSSTVIRRAVLATPAVILGGCFVNAHEILEKTGVNQVSSICFRAFYSAFPMSWISFIPQLFSHLDSEKGEFVLFMFLTALFFAGSMHLQVAAIDVYVKELYLETFSRTNAIAGACIYTGFLFLILQSSKDIVQVDSGLVSLIINIVIVLIVIELLFALTLCCIRPPDVRLYDLNDGLLGRSIPRTLGHFIYGSYDVTRSIIFFIISYCEYLYFCFVISSDKFFGKPLPKQLEYKLIMIMVLCAPSVFLIHAFIILSLHQYVRVPKHLSHSIDLVLGFFLSLGILNVFLTETTSVLAAIASCAFMFSAFLIF